MAEPEVTQHLAAILAADAAGYSRLMQADERATVATLDECRGVFREHIEARRGRVVDMAGDSVLAVFDSAVGAVEAALAVQSELARRNEALPEDRRMAFRIGVNSGDIMEKPDGTVYGDGVNVAARLEGLAEPGGITVSGSVYDSVRAKLGVGFAFLGEHAVKNIAEPVRAYRVAPEGAPAAPVKAKPPRARLAAIATSAVAVVAIGGVAVWQLTSVSEPEPAADPVLALPDGPAIAVLPFENVSGDPEQDYFATGLTEDIITRLSRFSQFAVIARNSTSQYKGKAVDVREVGRDLGARYVAEGSVRKAADTVRVSVQVLDAEDGTHLWAETYDRDLTAASLFAVQDEITEQVAGVIGDDAGILVRAELEAIKD